MASIFFISVCNAGSTEAFKAEYRDTHSKIKDGYFGAKGSGVMRHHLVQIANAAIIKENSDNCYDVNAIFHYIVPGSYVFARHMNNQKYVEKIYCEGTESKIIQSVTIFHFN